MKKLLTLGLSLAMVFGFANLALADDADLTIITEDGVEIVYTIEELTEMVLEPAAYPYLDEEGNTGSEEYTGVDVVALFEANELDTAAVASVVFSGEDEAIEFFDNGFISITDLPTILAITEMDTLKLVVPQVNDEDVNYELWVEDIDTIELLNVELAGDDADDAMEEELEELEDAIDDLEDALEDGPFADVMAEHWAKEYIEIIYALGVTQGIDTDEETGAIYYGPDEPLTRAQFVTFLGRLSTITLDFQNDLFDDIDDENLSYATNYIKWAATAGISNGISDTEFAPNSHITRQDMAVMVMRYVDIFGLVLPTPIAVEISDMDQVADYAVEAVQALSGTIMSISADGKFNPTALATRAEMAQLLASLQVAGIDFNSFDFDDADDDLEDVVEELEEVLEEVLDGTEQDDMQVDAADDTTDDVDDEELN